MTRGMMNQVQISDAIYAAGADAAGQLDKGAVPEGGGAARALAAALERRGLPVAPVVDADGQENPLLLSVGGHDGIAVTAAGDESALEVGGLLRRHHWQRVHLFRFARQGLGIKTISA